MKGRKPKPAEQKALEGNPGHRPLPEPVLVGGRPLPTEMIEPPAYLPDDAQEFWRDSVATLIEVGIIDRVDAPALEALATQYARMRQANRVVASEGHFARGSTGQLVQHPALKIEREATAMFMRLAEHYALTPIARVRLGMAELHRRSLAQELNDDLGGDSALEPVDARVVDD